MSVTFLPAISEDDVFEENDSEGEDLFTEEEQQLIEERRVV